MLRIDEQFLNNLSLKQREMHIYFYMHKIFILKTSK